MRFLFLVLYDIIRHNIHIKPPTCVNTVRNSMKTMCKNIFKNLINYLMNNRIVLFQ